MSFPVPTPTSSLDDYIAYVGFDPLTAQAQDKQKKSRHRAHRRAKAEAVGQRELTDGCHCPRIARHGAQDDYQPRRSMIAPLSARKSAITARAPAARRSSARRPSVRLGPTKPIGLMPAALAATTPAAESSTTIQSAGSTFKPLGREQKQVGRGFAPWSLDR